MGSFPGVEAFCAAAPGRAGNVPGEMAGGFFLTTAVAVRSMNPGAAPASRNAFQISSRTLRKLAKRGTPFRVLP